MSESTDLHYVELQLALEGIGIDARRRLIRIPATAAEDIPRLYVCRHGDGWARFYRFDLPEPIVDELNALSDETCFEDQVLIRGILRKHQPGVDVWVGTSYVFPEIPAPSLTSAVSRLIDTNLPRAAGLDPDLVSGRRPVYAMLVDGRIVSACVSARENTATAEAWVQTSPEFRRQGLARQVTAAWARDIIHQGKIAFYSHARDNVASRSVAAALGLRRFVDGVGYL